MASPGSNPPVDRGTDTEPGAAVLLKENRASSLFKENRAAPRKPSTGTRSCRRVIRGDLDAVQAGHDRDQPVLHPNADRGFLLFGSARGYVQSVGVSGRAGLRELTVV
jgi:hypothetical protein